MERRGEISNGSLIICCGSCGIPAEVLSSVGSDAIVRGVVDPIRP